MPYLKKIVPKPEPVDCRILTAALDLFVNRGFHNVSVHDVQKQADVSIGSIYNHFGGKEGIAKALYHHILKEVDEMVNCILEEQSGSVDRCNEIIRQLFNYTETHRNIIAYVFHPRHNEFLPDEPPICNTTPFMTIRDVIQQGMDAGEIRKHEIFVAAAAIFGGPIRMINLRLDNVIEEPLPNLLSDILDGIWQGMVTDKSVAASSDNISLISKSATNK